MGCVAYGGLYGSGIGDTSLKAGAERIRRHMLDYDPKLQRVIGFRPARKVQIISGAYA